MIKLTTPLDQETVQKLNAGDQVRLNGVLYTGRDAAHKRLVEAYQAGEKLPVDLKDQVIYYVGPCPARPSKVIGAAGPTTSGRMDRYAPLTIAQMGLRGMIGKGLRSQEVIAAIKKHSAVYFLAVGGAGALLSQRIKKAEIVAYADLGAEAIYRLEVEDFPVVVGIDCHGNDIYQEGIKKYKVG